MNEKIYLLLLKYDLIIICDIYFIMRTFNLFLRVSSGCWFIFKSVCVNSAGLRGMEPIYHLPAAASRIKWPLYISYKLDKVYI